MPPAPRILPYFTVVAVVMSAVTQLTAIPPACLPASAICTCCGCAAGYTVAGKQVAAQVASFLAVASRVSGKHGRMHAMDWQSVGVRATWFGVSAVLWTHAAVLMRWASDWKGESW